MSTSLRLTVVALFSLSLFSCGSPKSPPDLTKPGGGGHDEKPVRETPEEAFVRTCESKPDGRVILNGTQCRFEAYRLNQHRMPWWDNKPVQPPHVIDLGASPAKVLAFGLLKNGYVQLWDKKTGKNLAVFPWENYIQLPAGHYMITIKSTDIEELFVGIEACMDLNYKSVDCDVLP